MKTAIKSKPAVKSVVKLNLEMKSLARKEEMREALLKMIKK